MRVTFLGAAETVTGSKFLVQTRAGRALVDCGLFQGARAIRRRNWDDFPVAPESIDAVVLTHAHLDHCGYLPALVARGFRGSVYCSRNTANLVPIILRDSARLQEEDTIYARRSGYSRHAEPRPLYDSDDAEAAIALLAPRDFGSPFDVCPDLICELESAGHILGSSVATLTESVSQGRTARVVFSGDLGRGTHPLLKGPRPPRNPDVVVMESTYGNREHADVDAEMEEMAVEITRTIEQGGTVVVPAFAVDRTEVLLDALGRLMDQHRIPRVPIHVDSPMALAAMQVYREAISRGDAEVSTATLAQGPDRIDPGFLHPAHSPEQSKLLDVHGPKIIVSASGMGSGGRVTHHLKYFLPHRNNCVLLVGYQAFGTPGQQLRDGAHAIRIHGQDVPVRARIVDIEAFSVHADAGELVEWLASSRDRPREVYLVHGEPEAAEHLATRIRRELALPTFVARDGESFEVEPD